MFTHSVLIEIRTMRKFIVSVIGLFALTLMVAPAAEAKISTRGLPKFIHSESSALDTQGDARGLGVFKRSEENKKYVFANGKVTAVGATSITVAVRSKKSDDIVTTQSDTNTNSEHGTVVTTSYTFAVDSTTMVIRKFKGKASIAEVAVGDSVKLWGTKFEGGVAKLIWDKSIWWGQIRGTITDLNPTTKTFKLVLKQKISETGVIRTVAATVKTNTSTTFWMGGAAKAFTDLANDQKVTLRGSWNSANMYFLASKVTISE